MKSDLSFPSFTAHKRSLRRLCFYTCLSFCSQAGCISQHAMGQTPPPRKTDPLPGRNQEDPPSGRPSPPGRNQEDPPLKEDRPPLQEDRPPGAVHAGSYGQQAGGTHPTGMHTCLNIFLQVLGGMAPLPHGSSTLFIVISFTCRL